MSARDILKLMKSKEIEYLDLRFTDPRGKLQHLTMDSTIVDEEMLNDGVFFDGSSIAGWKAINESDMILKPDLSRKVIDPYTSHNTLILFCDILDAVKRNPYERFLSVWTFGHRIDPSSLDGRHELDPGKTMWETHKEYNKYKPSELKTTMEDMTKKDWQKSFEEFCVTYDKGEIYDAHAHLMSKDLHLFPEDTFEFVEISELENSKIYNKLFIEDPHRSIEEFYQGPDKYGLTGINRHINPSHKYLSNWKDYYNDNTKELVYKFMKQDFENLKYSEDF